MLPMNFPARKNVRRKQAEDRKVLRDKLSVFEQIHVIESRKGSSIKEKLRLMKQINNDS